MNHDLIFPFLIGMMGGIYCSSLGFYPGKWLGKKARAKWQTSK